MKILRLVPLLLVLLLYSCNNKTSLQEYYVEHRVDTSFVALDIPASLVLGDNSRLEPEQRAVIETIDKINLLGYPASEENKEAFEKEKLRLKKILADEKYQTLMKFKSGTMSAELFYLGEDDAIDELIVFGSDQTKGFGVARVLGENMNPEDLINLVHSLRNGNLDLEGLEELLFRK